MPESLIIEKFYNLISHQSGKDNLCMQIILNAHNSIDKHTLNHQHSVINSLFCAEVT